MRALDAIGGLSGRLLTVGLLHAAWVGLAVAAVVAARQPHWGRLSHAARYRRLLAALALAAVGPVLATAGQWWLCVSERPVEPAATLRVSTRPTASGPGEAPWVGLERGHDRTTEPHVSAAGRRLAAGLAWAAGRLESARPGLLAVWLAVVVALSIRLAVAAVAVGNLRRSSSGAPRVARRRALVLSRRLGLRRVPGVRAHARLSEPCVCGLVRPTVLLPGGWAESARLDDLDAILAHELSHARRHDLPANLAQRVVEIALFFHPGVRWLSRAVRREREFCADAEAVAATGDPFALASALESLARRTASGRAAWLLGAPFGGDAPSLLSRVQELLGMTPTPVRRRFWPVMALPCAGVLALAAGSLGLAQEAPKEEPPKRAVADRPDEIVVFKIDGNVAPASISVRSEPAVDLEAIDPNAPQTSYEVRLITVTPGPLLDEIKQATAPLADAKEVRCWVWDEATTRAMLAVVQGDVRSNIIQAPKVTTFDGTAATISDTKTIKYVSKVEPLLTRDSYAFKPTVDEIESGLRLTVEGTRAEGAIALAVDLRDRDLTWFDQITVPLKTERRMIHAKVELPCWVDRTYRGEVTVPEGETLAVSLGTFERTYRKGGPLGKLLGLIREAGGPALDKEQGSIEKLVLITPRQIILEEEEERLGVPAEPQAGATKP